MRPALLVILLLSALSACGEGAGAEQAPTELTGVIVQVDESGNEITAFTLEAGGDRYTVFIAKDVSTASTSTISRSIGRRETRYAASSKSGANASTLSRSWTPET